MNQFASLFFELYDKTPTNQSLLNEFCIELRSAQHAYTPKCPQAVDWYKDAVVYAMYVQDYNVDFAGLIERLVALKDLGITCLWLLPILESPMQDAGFDISDYTRIRPDIVGDSSFDDLISAAHAMGIKVIFDIALNHCSIKHAWFQSARRDRQSPYRNFFIWSEQADRYQDARIIFKGICKSNWQYDEIAGQYYFHRFFEIQPDLNYRNPEVLLAMCRVLIGWKLKGIDGFRADAIPYIWKEDGTICENLPKTHTVVKFFRAVLSALDPSTLLLAEACQPPSDVVAYFGDGDECQGAYHFPLMPRIYLALATANHQPIIETLSPSVTPSIPDHCQWFTFLRCHDELTLEMVSPDERQVIYQHYAKLPTWDFRQGEGISARIVDLFGGDLNLIALAYSIMFSLPGTPVIYYGDEYAKPNDEDYRAKMVEATGLNDSRYLVRGPIDWRWVDAQMADTQSLSYRVYHALVELISAKRRHPSISRGKLKWLPDVPSAVLAYQRTDADERILIVQNLATEHIDFKHPILRDVADVILGPSLNPESGSLVLSAHQYAWLKLNSL